MTHIVLLGDSIFDNQAYTGEEPDVVSHLRKMIPQDWEATLRAIDGSVVENVVSQLTGVPETATHFVISAGGNNAIMNADILGLKVNSSAEVFDLLSRRVSNFESNYREMLKTVLSRHRHTAVCTIYFPNFPDSFMQKIASQALSAFNDVIIRQAVSLSLPVIDLRFVCSGPDDYANEIEPSGQGGQKIAAKIRELVEGHDFTSQKTQIFV